MPVTALDADAVDDPCPTDVPVDMDSQSSMVFDETSRLEPMLGIVLQYGQQRPDVFGGYGLHWLDAGDASVFVSFTDDVAEHRAALIERVESPDELIVCQAPASEADRRAVQATLTDELAGRYTRIQSDGVAGAVTVYLHLNEELLAEQLVQRYGAAVDVRVGALEYPLDVATSVCGPTHDRSLIDGLTIAIVDADTPLAPTGQGTVPLTIRLTNTGNEPVRFDSGRPHADVTDPQARPLSQDTWVRLDEGIRIELDPGDHQDFELDVSLASCNPTLGYMLPPGDHHVVVALYNGQLHTDMYSEPLPVIIGD